MKKRHTWGNAVCAMAALSLLLSGCGATSGSGDNGTDTYADYVQPADGITSDYTGDLPTPDPSKAYDNPQPRDNVKDGGTLTQDIYELTTNWNYLSTDGNTVALAELWAWYQPHLWDYSVGGDATPNPDYLDKVEVTSEDPLVVTYDINEKATWNDGTPIDYTAFQATWKALNGTDPDYNPPQTVGYEDIASVEKGESDKQVVVTFAKPYYPYEGMFSALVHPKAVDAATFTQGWVKNPHNEWAAGPYVVESHDDSQVTLVRNEKWWGNKGKLDKVIFKIMKDSAAVNAFQNGEIDTLGGRASVTGVASSKDTLKIVREMDGVQLRMGYSLDTQVFVYNGKAGALQDLAVRKAITQAFDQSTWSEIKYQGVGWNAAQPKSSVILQFQSGYEDNMPADSGYDVDTAKKTLEAAGYTMGDDGYYQKDGKTVEVSYTFFGDSSTQSALATAYQAMLKKAGVKVELRNLDTSKFSDTVVGADYEVLPMAWSASDPFGYAGSAAQFYKSDSSSNYAYVGSDEIDELVSIPGTLKDSKEAIKAANKAEKAALELYGMIPVVTPPTYMAVKKGLANVGPAGFQQITQHREDIGWQKD